MNRQRKGTRFVAALTGALGFTLWVVGILANRHILLATTPQAVLTADLTDNGHRGNSYAEGRSVTASRPGECRAIYRWLEYDGELLSGNQLTTATAGQCCQVCSEAAARDATAEQPCNTWSWCPGAHPATACVTLATFKQQADTTDRGAQGLSAALVQAMRQSASSTPIAAG